MTTTTERRPLPSAEELRPVFTYDPETGDILRLPQRRTASYINGRGYLTGKFQRRKFYAHRLAWVLHHGDWPLGQIDHINGDRSDNRICNLRDVSASENKRNSSLPSNNTSGHHGVYFIKERGTW